MEARLHIAHAVNADLRQQHAEDAATIERLTREVTIGGEAA